jgi:hypothetical protein
MVVPTSAIRSSPPRNRISRTPRQGLLGAKPPNVRACLSEPSRTAVRCSCDRRRYGHPDRSLEARAYVPAPPLPTTHGATPIGRRLLSAGPARHGSTGRAVQIGMEPLECAVAAGERWRLGASPDDRIQGARDW